MKRKLIIIGHARHGKDTVAEFLAKKLDLKFKGSSEICAEFVFEKLKDKYGYRSVKKCFNDRAHHRAEWHNIIAEYCKDDKARLGKLIFEENDIYCGIRAKDELEAVMAEFDCMVLWVDASKRMPLEPVDSMQLNFDPERFDYLDNNGTLEELLEQLQ